jgi:hypothetical protein
MFITTIIIHCSFHLSALNVFASFQIFVGSVKLNSFFFGGIEVTGRQGRRRMKLLDDLKERRGYCHLKEEALDCTMWRARFGRGFGPVVRQTTK